MKKSHKEFEILQDTDENITIRLFSVGECDARSIKNLTNATVITAEFDLADGSKLIKSLTEGQIIVSNPLSGSFDIVLNRLDTLALKTGRCQDFVIRTVIDGKSKAVKFYNCLTVVKC